MIAPEPFPDAMATLREAASPRRGTPEPPPSLSLPANAPEHIKVSFMLAAVVDRAMDQHKFRGRGGILRGSEAIDRYQADLKRTHRPMRP